MQPAASRPIARRMETVDSFALDAASLRGKARNGIAKAFTKHAAASAAVSASRAPATGNMTRVRLPVVPKPASNA